MVLYIGVDNNTGVSEDECLGIEYCGSMLDSLEGGVECWEILSCLMTDGEDIFN